jgi:adenosylcobinamide amidohydrolase
MTTTVLSTGAIVSVDDCRVRVDLPLSSLPHHRYRSLSSAILNGGDHALSSLMLPLPSLPSSSSSSSSHCCRVINCLVPPTYDGLPPPPLDLLARFAREEGDDPENPAVDPRDTIGLLTAESMKTCATSSRRAGGMCVDIVVTAGLSNSRCAGADADYFAFASRNNDIDDDDADGGTTTTTPAPPDAGTINAIVIIDGMPLNPAARVEAYAIAIKAKCLAFSDHGVMCKKDPTRTASGTGTDCCVLISPTLTTTTTTTSDNDDDIRRRGRPRGEGEKSNEGRRRTRGEAHAPGQNDRAGGARGDVRGDSDQHPTPARQLRCLRPATVGARPDVDDGRRETDRAATAHDARAVTSVVDRLDGHVRRPPDIRHPLVVGARGRDKADPRGGRLGSIPRRAAAGNPSRLPRWFGHRHVAEVHSRSGLPEPGARIRVRTAVARHHGRCLSIRGTRVHPIGRCVGGVWVADIDRCQ